MRALSEYIIDLDDPRKEAVLAFHQDHLALMRIAKVQNINIKPGMEVI